MASVTDWLRELPKAELHLHLEGSVGPEVIRRWRPDLASDEVQRRFAPTNFAEFIDSYRFVCQQLDTPAHYAEAVKALAADLQQQGVDYAEVTLSAGVVLWRGMNLAEVYQAIWDASQAVAGQVKLRWVLDAIRHFGVDAARPVVEFAASQGPAGGIVGFGIGGDEQRGPVRDFTELFAFARQSGLHLVPHAGETVGPESIWAALEAGAERIGHGIRAVDDPTLVKHLADRQIPLEICITSNIRLGLVTSAAEHPVRQLYEAGVPITLNTDDPALFATTLTAEYSLAQTALGFTPDILRELAANSRRYAFAL